MSYDENDAAYDRFIDELHKDFREQTLDDAELYDRVVDDFKASRLLAFYVQEPAVAQAAQGALRDASDLLVDHPRAALVFAITAAEVCLRSALRLTTQSSGPGARVAPAPAAESPSVRSYAATMI
jgi:hypothetical protein